VFNALRRELLKIILAVAAGVLIGLWAGHPAAGAAIAMALCFAIHLRYIGPLRAWVDHPKRFEILPEAGGIWGEIYARLIELQRRNRKRKKRLAAMLAEFQASAEALTDGAVVLDEAGRIAWFNNAAQAMLGLKFPQDIGQRIPNLVRAPAFTEYFAAGDYERDLEIRAPENAALTLALRLIPYGHNQKLLMVRDVSEMRRLEHVRRDFVANASHELRTPLTVLRGYLEMMEPGAREGGALADWRSPLSEMRNQTLRMEALITDLLKLAQMESGMMQSRQELLDVPAMLEQALKEAHELSQGRHKIESEVEGDLLLYGRELEARSIFSNLLTNAMQYTPAGGKIRLTWQSLGQGGGRFAVADNGIGIEPGHIPRLTERFYRVDVGRSRASGGTGLGLSIVKHALENLDGELRIESKPGAGSTFICEFPPHRVSRQAAPVPIAVPR
jgi:two-component system phosphate regulon sensor histidine kinase PhoR